MEDFINARDNAGMTPLLVAAMNSGIHGGIESMNNASQAQISCFIDILINSCKANIELTVGKENRKEKVK